MPDSTQALIDTLWDFDDPAASEARFRHAIDQSELGIERAELITQLARAQGLQRRIEDAHCTLDQIEHQQRSNESVRRYYAVRMRLLLERGRLFQSPEARKPLFESAYEGAHTIGADHLAIDAAHMIAIVYGAQNQHDHAMQWNLKALAIAESSSQPRARKWLASLHNNIAWSLHDQGDFTQAMHHFRKAFDERLLHGNSRDIRVARWCIARTLRSMNRFEESFDMQQSLLHDAETLKQTPDGFVYEELAECLLALHRDVEAAPYFRLAHQLLAADAGFCQQQSSRLARLAKLGGVTG